jgi:hypothetical protein
MSKRPGGSVVRKIRPERISTTVAAAKGSVDVAEATPYRHYGV